MQILDLYIYKTNSDLMEFNSDYK